jgi:hypothetical protein
VNLGAPAARRQEPTAARSPGPAPRSREKTRTPRVAMGRSASLWQTALLPVREKGLSAESVLYLTLTAAIAGSLLMAFWRLRTLEAGWGSFVELVTRIVS